MQSLKLAKLFVKKYARTQPDGHWEELRSYNFSKYINNYNLNGTVEKAITKLKKVIDSIQ